MPDQTMKPATAAKKLGILLSASPESFQTATVTRSAFLELQSTPPEWLSVLRRDGPHPRDVVARKLGVSTSGLARAGVTESLTTAQLKDLLETMPDWLVTERTRQAGVRDENARIKSERVARAESASAHDRTARSRGTATGRAVSRRPVTPADSNNPLPRNRGR